MFMSFFFKNLVLVLSFVAILSGTVASFSVSNVTPKVADATIVNACSVSETLEGTNCVFTKVSNIQYETKCAVGYTLMDAVCAKFSTQSCSYFNQGLNAENGLCKLDLSRPVYGTEISDNDGRQCNGVGTNFKRYNVGLPNNSTSGPVVCGNNFSLLDKTTFRFLPRVITEISNLASIQTQNIYQPCPSGYTELVTNKCSRPATAQGCSVGGEIFINNSCVPCPAGQYCPGDGVIIKLVTVCANGGTLSGNQCVAANKYPSYTYTDGCPIQYTKKDQSCAVVEDRTHDLGCSYFYTSENINVTAIQGSDGYCSTGGRVDFALASIVRISDFNCNGAGTYYYNYNVAYDPIVCGNDYNLVGKTGFKWLPTTFTRITALQKISTSMSVCPVGWTSFDNSNNCSQPPIVQEYRNSVDCPVNTYCPGSNVNPNPCPAGSTSVARSTTVSNCVFIACTNAATNPPSCNQCPAGLQLTNNLCLPICPIAVSRDSSNNCTICNNGTANPSSGCNACPGNFRYNGSSCVIIVNQVCSNGFETVNNSCVCVSPKVITNKLVSSNSLYQLYCENQVSSSFSVATTATNNGGTININNNPNYSTVINVPVSNNNLINNVVNNYPASVSEPISKPQFIPMATPVKQVIYSQSPVVNVAETIRSGGFNVILIISTLVTTAAFGLVYIRGKRNQNFGNFTSKNYVEK
jgi:hypothetical protein